MSLILLILLKPEYMKKLSKMKEEASTQEQQMQELVQQLTESDGLDPEKIESTATETAEKCSKIMETYLGEDPDTQEALEFLCLAEGGEVTHYEVLASVAKDVINKKFGTTVRAILKEYCSSNNARMYRIVNNSQRRHKY
jgi:predicted DsbA family dithiol-disulfide isomerase